MKLKKLLEQIGPNCVVIRIIIDYCENNRLRVNEFGKYGVAVNETVKVEEAVNEVIIVIYLNFLHFSHSYSYFWQHFPICI